MARFAERSSLLDLAILGLLKENDLHGYELSKRLGAILGPGARVSFGSVYPALGRLERAGAVAVAGARSLTGVPATGSLEGELSTFRHLRGRPAGKAGRRRKVYTITDEGAALFDRLLTTEPKGDGDRQFSVRLMFATYLLPQARLSMLERRRRQLQDRLGAESGTEKEYEKGSYMRLVLDHDREAVQHDLAWVERLIEWERVEGSAPRGTQEAPGTSPRAAGEGALRRQTAQFYNSKASRPSITALLSEARLAAALEKARDQRAPKQP